MSRRRRRLEREHGRIMSVETKVRGDALAEDAAAGATTLVVADAGDFDEDGGWLTINGQVVEYLEVDDDEGTITLATGLTAAADDGDAVHVWSTLYDEAVDYQEALVELDGEYDNPEPVVAEVAEGVGDLPEGDRGVAGESCTLLRISDDEWEIVGVGGRARKSRSLRFEADDVYVLTADDVTAGTATVPLSHRPIDESVVAWWRTTPQEPTEYTINYDAQTITYPLDGFEAAGDRIWVHYAYRKGVTTPVVDPEGTFIGYSNSSTGGAPAGTQIGDLMVLFMTMKDAHTVVNLNGWTLADTSAAVTWVTSTWGSTNSLMRVFWKVAESTNDPTPTVDNSAAPTFVDWGMLTFRGVSAVSEVAFATLDVAASSFAAPSLAGGDVSHLRALRDADQTLEWVTPVGATVYGTQDFYRIGVAAAATTDPFYVISGNDGVTPVAVDWIAATISFG